MPGFALTGEPEAGGAVGVPDLANNPGLCRVLGEIVVADADDGSEPVEAIIAGFEAVAAVTGRGPEASEQRARIIAAHDELQEHELKKFAS